MNDSALRLDSIIGKWREMLDLDDNGILKPRTFNITNVGLIFGEQLSTIFPIEIQGNFLLILSPRTKTLVQRFRIRDVEDQSMVLEEMVPEKQCECPSFTVKRSGKAWDHYFHNENRHLLNLHLSYSQIYNILDYVHAYPVRGKLITNLSYVTPEYLWKRENGDWAGEPFLHFAFVLKCTHMPFPLFQVEPIGLFGKEWNGQIGKFGKLIKILRISNQTSYLILEKSTDIDQLAKDLDEFVIVLRFASYEVTE